MVYMRDTGIMRASDLRFKYIGPHTIDINYKDKLLMIIDTEKLKSTSMLQNDLVVMQKIIDIALQYNISVDRDEIDKFIQGGYRNV